jgi:hypothetical protein
MKVAVVTPTMRYGGLAEQYAHLLRQTRQPDYWIIADDLWEKRYARVFAETSNSPFKVVHYLPRPKPEGYFSDLAGIMNESLDLCAEFEADLIISLQDYIWIQDDGIERFVDLFRGPCEGDLISGLTSHADVPTLDDVVDINDPWTIFEEPYLQKPPTTYWNDPRADQYPPPGVYLSNPVAWEMNWCSMPGDLVKEGLRMDEVYGKGIGHENQDLSFQAKLFHGRDTWVDSGNWAYSLPHKRYWQHEEEVGIPHSLSNMEYHLNKWRDYYNALGLPTPA